MNQDEIWHRSPGHNSIESDPITKVFKIKIHPVCPHDQNLSFGTTRSKIPCRKCIFRDEGRIRFFFERVENEKNRTWEPKLDIVAREILDCVFLRAFTRGRKIANPKSREQQCLILARKFDFFFNERKKPFGLSLEHVFSFWWVNKSCLSTFQTFRPSFFSSKDPCVKKVFFTLGALVNKKGWGKEFFSTLSLHFFNPLEKSFISVPTDGTKSDFLTHWKEKLFSKTRKWKSISGKWKNRFSENMIRWNNQSDHFSF